MKSSETALGSEWWLSYQDPTLSALIEQALDRNLDIRIQAQRVEEFRARLGFSRAEQYPTLGGQLGAARERMPGQGTYTQFIEEPPHGQDRIFRVSLPIVYSKGDWRKIPRAKCIFVRKLL